jgi:predicted O-linked N-acetylglucosamine transferase (SPINDLY family)
MKILLTVLLIGFVCSASLAQDSQANALMKRGAELNNQGNYAGAIEKYREVLKSDSGNNYANYQIAFSLNASDKGAEAIPYLKRVIKSNDTTLTIPAYSLMGSIYDNSHQTPQSIEAYNEVIKINPGYPQIYYNLGIAYSRNQQYAEAEACAIEAIKHDPKNANSQRLYALAAMHQRKLACALLGLCSFILLEPHTQRTVEAYNNIQHVIEGSVTKVTKGANGTSTIQVSLINNKENAALDMGISRIVMSGQIKELKGQELLQFVLENTFMLAGRLSEKKNEKRFFDTFLAGYFYELAGSGNMQTFITEVSLSADKEKNEQWLKDNPQKADALNNWIESTQRGF